MFRIIILMASVLFSSLLSAQQYSHTGNVMKLRSHDLTNYGAGVDWVSIQGFQSAGLCKLSGPYVVIRVKDDDHGKKQFSMLLAAKISNRTVTVWVDDTYSDVGGYCYLSFIDIH